jgi:hypothetical protein
LVLISVTRRVDLSVMGEMKNVHVLVGNQTCGLPACGIVPSEVLKNFLYVSSLKAILPTSFATHRGLHSRPMSLHTCACAFWSDKKRQVLEVVR